MLPVYKLNLICDDAKQTISSNPKCSWSSTNWILYAPNTCCKSNGSGIDSVYIFNPNTPDDVFTLKTNHQNYIEHIEWVKGTCKFITVDLDSICKIWSNERPNNFINSWECISEFNLGNGDMIIKLLVINNRNIFNWDLEKMFHKDFLKKFPQNIGIGLENNDIGLAAVTSTGVLHVAIVQEDIQEPPIIHKTKLVLYKSYVHSADMILNVNGKLFVAVHTDPNMIELFSVSMKIVSTSDISFATDVWPCLVPQLPSGNFEIVCFRCLSINGTDKVLVNLQHPSNGSLIQLFEVKKEPVKLHPRFPVQTQQNQTVADSCVCLYNIKFQQSKTLRLTTDVNFISKGISDISFMPMFLLTDSSSLQFYSAYDSTRALYSSQFLELNTEVIAAVLSPCQHGLFVFTKNGNGILYIVPHFSNFDKPMTGIDKLKIKYIVTMMQYSLIESFIPWALILSISILEKHLIDQIRQCFLETMKDCDNSIKQLMAGSTFHQLQLLIYFAKKDYCSVLESTYSVIVCSIYTYISSLLKSGKEQMLMDSIEKLCASTKDFEINKISQLIDLKDINLSLLTDSVHRPLIQWVIDYGVHFVRLILCKNHSAQNWKSIITYLDPTTMILLRRLLLLFYIMYQKHPQVLHMHAIFIAMANSIDVVSQLYKLSIKLQQICEGDMNIDIVMNDLPFNSLPMMYLDIPSTYPSNGVLEQLTYSTSSQLMIEEFEACTTHPWFLLKQKSFQNPLYVGISTVAGGLRQIYDGINFTPSSLMHGEVVKQCCVCGCISILVLNSSRICDLNWNAAWKKNCICGGYWKLVNWND
ncbi:uncharacterized protein LOC136078707 [Hydra vulgaris]|uniref:Uncharacterized protein LOC136078707 n=1 Tax=Hydra vulgaris TaxID=6087 RepID=A0ABM4BNB1_HYDVU